MLRREGKRWACVLAGCMTLVPACAATFDELARQAGAARDADRVPEAIELYQPALQLKPDWPEGWSYLGALFYDSDRYAEAQGDLWHFWGRR